MPKLRIVSYFGDWLCECGRQNRLWDTCKCAKAGPCRDWVRGRCKYGDACRSVSPILGRCRSYNIESSVQQRHCLPPTSLRIPHLTLLSSEAVCSHLQVFAPAV
jgi:hypothetical protein